MPDWRILYRLHHQPEPERIWVLINEVVALDNLNSRHERDVRRLEVWQRLRMLIRVGIAERVNRHFVQAGPVIAEWRKDGGSTPIRHVGQRLSRQHKRRKASEIRKLIGPKDVINQERISTSSRPQTTITEGIPLPVLAQPTKAEPAEPDHAPQTPIDPSNAARQLATRRWHYGHRWTGWIQGQRVRMNQPVRLPDGTPADVLLALRGRVIVAVDDEHEINGNVFITAPAHLVKLIKTPSAVALGRLKLGTRERFSEAKAVSSRRNGARPVRPGSRPRGRPRRSLPGDMPH